MRNAEHIRTRHWLSTAAMVLMLLSGAAFGENMRPDAGAHGEIANARLNALASQVDYADSTESATYHGDAYSVAAPHEHTLTERNALPASPVKFGRLSAYFPDTVATDVAVAWSYRRSLGRDPALTFGYTARARFDSAPGDLTHPRSNGEYRIRADLQREIGDFAPRVELGYIYVPPSFHDTAAAPRMFGAVGMTYYRSDRSTLDLFFDQRAPVPGGATQRELSFTWTERTSARTRVIFYADKSVSEKWADVGVKVSLRF